MLNCTATILDQGGKGTRKEKNYKSLAMGIKSNLTFSCRTGSPGRYDNPIPSSTKSPRLGTKNLASGT